MKIATHTATWTILVLLAFGIPFLPAATASLEYDRAATSAGQLWRLVTCHWTHWSTHHLFWSGGAFAALAIACHRVAPRRGLACVAASAPVVGGTGTSGSYRA